MKPETSSCRLGLLVSGGLDSSILLAHLLDQGWAVQPFYIRSGLSWEDDERRLLARFLAHRKQVGLAPLVTLELPLADLYGSHWSISGIRVPQADTPDEAVFMPGRNPLLIVKAGLWCLLNGIQRLALGALGTNPFPDATADFLQEFGALLGRGMGSSLEIARPFADLSKQQVMELGRELPLHWTFSCINPLQGLHCGRCNKCAERQAAFRLIQQLDPTVYAPDSTSAIVKAARSLPSLSEAAPRVSRDP